MATITTNYGTIAQSITITLNSLADGSARESTAVSNTTNKFVDVLISGTAEAATGVTDGTLYLYVYGRTASGKYSGSASGTDAAYGASAGQVIENLKLLDRVKLDAATTENFEFGPFSIAQIMGVVPDEWGIVAKWVDNSGSAALHSANNTLTYQGIKYDVA